VDETSFLRAGPTRRTRFVTGLVDLRSGRLLDLVDGRAASAVSGWLAGRDQAWLSAVERVALDPYRGYYNALVGGLDAPEVVVDAFHVVRVRREAPCVRAGGRSPPSACRSRPLKLGAA
jgi:transposase